MKLSRAVIRLFFLISSLLISVLSAADENSADKILDDCKTADTNHHPLLEYQTTMALLRPTCPT